MAKSTKKKQRASESELGNLHELFSAFLKEELKRGEPTVGLLNVIRQFLKDNDISCIPEENENMMGILQVLPKFTASSDIADDVDDDVGSVYDTYSA